MAESAEGFADLYDRVHAAMVDWLLGEIRRSPEAQAYGLGYRTYPEFVYNYYGHKGSVDILTYHAQGSDKTPGGVVELYELWSGIHRLEEALRKFNEKAEFVPKYFQQTRKPGEKLGLQRNYFVLLNTLENVTLIKDNWHTFTSQFREFHKIVDIVDRAITNQLVLVDPLHPQYFPIRDAGENGMTLVPSLPWIVVSLPGNVDERLQQWSCVDAADFWQRYRQRKTGNR